MGDRGRLPSKEELVAALEREGANVSRVGQRFGLGRNVIYRLMREHEIRKDGTDQ